MAVRCQITQWTIEFLSEPVANPPRGGVLVFDIVHINGINIDGNVSLQAGGSLGTFTGTCRAVQQDQLNLMTFEFVWGAANIVLAGVAFVGNVNRFTGRFNATAHAFATAMEEEAAKKLLAQPDPGDTGTGNGTQT